MDIKKTEDYYKTAANEQLCDCTYCLNYCANIKDAYAPLADYLRTLDIDIEKPFEVSCIEPNDDGTIDYLGAMYVIMGNKSDFVETDISGVNVFIEDSHPMTDIDEEHFVISTSPLTLKWTIPPHLHT